MIVMYVRQGRAWGQNESTQGLGMGGGVRKKKIKI